MRPRHDEHGVGRRWCPNDEHQQQTPRSCSQRYPRGQGANAPCPHRLSGCRARERASVHPLRSLTAQLCVSLFLTRSRAPPAWLSLCSQTLSERAGRFVLADKEGPERERWHERASARPCSDMVGLVVCGTAREASGAAVRVGLRTYRTGRASTVPVPCSYGVGLGVLFVSRSLIVPSVCNICRLGDTVVSGPRETRLNCHHRGGPPSLAGPCQTFKQTSNRLFK